MNNETTPAHIHSGIVLEEEHMGQSPMLPIPIGRATAINRAMRISANRRFIGSSLAVTALHLPTNKLCARDS